MDKENVWRGWKRDDGRLINTNQREIEYDNQIYKDDFYSSFDHTPEAG